eukprot:CAMPEP_0117517240 /NCGR_PEP_ID=MMETSP0784-20121206/31510_1 /TAXON_ID=39447 /ORGANISM="" /LENGTH=410 /DNA_ID=CAMNT_0005313115 /DNA_START=23 /DNA_END=1255 /DNA_ORIENTATION=-
MPALPREVGGFTIGRQLGSGSFGEVYKVRKDGREAAAKFERTSIRRPQLAHEWKLYNSLAGCLGVPRVHWFGSVGRHSVMIMDLLGPSLEEVFSRHGRIFSLKTVLMLADQLISRLQLIHGTGILHRDIKPNNFLIGRGHDVSQVYVVDFGLSKSYIDKRTGGHIAYRDGRKGLTGTARYTSINNHMGVELARRDDMEGLGYVLLRMLRGALPWQGVKAENKQVRNERIKEKKLATSVEELCRGLPREFASYMDCVRLLRFDEEPPYDALRSLMLSCLERKRLEYDSEFDWCATKASTSASTAAGSSEDQGPSISTDEGQRRPRRASTCEDRGGGAARRTTSRRKSPKDGPRRRRSSSKHGAARRRHCRSRSRSASREEGEADDEEDCGGEFRAAAAVARSSKRSRNETS